MKAKLNKKVTLDFLCLVKNPEELLKKDIEWEKVEGDEKTIDALWEFYLAGCEIIINSLFDEKEISEFLDKHSLWETGLKIMRN